MEMISIGLLLNFKLTTNDGSLNFRMLDFRSHGGSVIGDIYHLEGFVQGIGTIAHYRVLTNPIICFKGSMSLFSSSPNILEANNRVQGYMSMILNSLWFIKDNSCLVSDCFTQTPDAMTSVNRMDSLYSTASGEYRLTEFTAEEIERADYFINKIIQITTIDPQKRGVQPEGMTEGFHVDEMALLPYNEHARLGRSFYFLHLARATTFLPLKISLYVAILECLFTSDRTEVTHKVTEAATLFIGGDYDTKLKNFELVKDAYGVRSSYLHGQQLKKKYNIRQNLVDLSIKTDEFIRSVFIKAFENQQPFELDEEKYKDWFRDLILSKPIN